MLTRRQLLSGLGAAAWSLQAGVARATTARALDLPELLRLSGAVSVATPIEARSRWEHVGGQRRIVTYVRLQLEQAWLGESEAQPLVRTLGGQVGDIGQIVHGEAPLALGQRALLFLTPLTRELRSVAGMAQGHYPLLERPRSPPLLTRSPGLATLVDVDAAAAVVRLSGLQLEDASRLVVEAAREAR